MRLGTYILYENPILGWTMKKKVWVDYEQLLRPVF